MIVRDLGTLDYHAAWDAMRAFTEARTPESVDELWLVEHPSVYTQGIAGRPEHLLANPRRIPVIASDRGGQITYHGPGQAVVYVLFDLRRAGYGVRELVTRIESAVIEVLAEYGLTAYGRRDAPGVYVEPDGAKIASLGLKIRRGCTYHGVALNVAMDLAPFLLIDPCGQPGLVVTQLADRATFELPPGAVHAVGRRLCAALTARL